MHGYAQFFARRRGLLWALVLTASVVAAFGLTRLSVDDVPREIFAVEDETYERLLRVYEDFGVDDNDAFLVLESEDVLSPESLRVSAELASKAVEIEGVDEVTWAGSIPVFDGGLLPTNLEAIAARDPDRVASIAHAHSLIGRRFVSEDQRTALVLCRFANDRIAIEQIEPGVRELRELVASTDSGDVRVRVTGIPPIRVDIFRIIREDQVRFFLIGGVLSTLVALLLFRNLGAVVASVVPPLFGALWAYGVLGLIGAKLDLLSGVLSMLVIVIALTDSVHLMIDVRISRAQGLGKVEAAADAIRHLGLPCFLTSLTTAVGFGSLGLGTVPAIRNFGLLASISVAMAFLAVITVMPLIASLFEHVGESHARAPREAQKFWSTPPGRFLTGVLRRPVLVTGAGVLATLALLSSTVQLVPENRLTEALPQEEAYEALMATQEAFGGILPAYVLVEWPEGASLDDAPVETAVADVAHLLEEIEGLGRPFSYLDYLDAVPGGRARPTATLELLPNDAVRAVLRDDLGQALVGAPVPDEGSERMLPMFEAIEEGLEELSARHAGFAFHLTGTDYVARSNINLMIDDLARSLSFAVQIIFGVIALEFRSIRLGLMSLLPNLFPLVLVGGALKVFGLPLQMGSAVLFTVLLGLAVDDTIHFLARYRRERRAARERGDDPDALEVLEAAYLAVGRAIGVTTLVLVVAFGAVALSTVPTNRIFAVMSCLGLVGALIGDLVLLPAALRLGARLRSS